MKTSNDIPEVPVVALVGRKEAAAMLGVKPENLFRDVPTMPRPLQDRRIRGFNVSTGPLWPRTEIAAVVRQFRAERRTRARQAERARNAKKPRAAADGR